MSDDSNQHPLIYPALNFVLEYGKLAVTGLFVAGLVFGSKGVVTLALLSAACAYVSMFLLTLAFMAPNRDAEWVHSIETMANPMLTALAALFWVAGVYQLWG